MNTSAGRILIVDDEVNIRHGLRAVLSKKGYTVEEADSAEAALSKLESFAPEVAIVDVRMPGASGIELLTAVRGRQPHVAVIMLTGHGTLESAMAAVKAGAHDYLLKPAQPDTIRHTVMEALLAARRNREQAQLLASLQAGLERLNTLPVAEPAEAWQSGDRRMITVGVLGIDLAAHEVRLKGEPVALTLSEFKLLVVLAMRAGEAVDYVSLVAQSLDYEAETWEARELIKRHIFALRQKLEPDPAKPQYILNVRGVGYRLARPHDA